MSPENKRVVVDRHHWCGASHSDMGENIGRVCILAQRMEGEIIAGRCTVLVERRPGTFFLAKFLLRSSIPRYAKAIHVEHAISGCDFLLRRRRLGIVGHEFGQIVVVDLFRKRVCLGSSSVHLNGMRQKGFTGVMRTSSRIHCS